MNPFDRRWRELARTARAAQRKSLPEVDALLGPQLLRRGMGSSRRGEAVEELWRWYGVRGLVASMTILMVCLALAWRAGREPALGRPAVENAVAETFSWL
ncbi:MAG: hypothetical protein JNK85_01895 [Verrucomicrobiales bacterium]|nr:hypothetical protein [Verrucomicrobiales bacterium]